MSAHRTLLPAGWPRPRGYSNGVAAAGLLVMTGGVIGWDCDERFACTSLVGQLRQILINTLAILAEADARAEHVMRMTWYITDRAAYLEQLPAIGDAWREVFGANFPPMAVVEVAALVGPQARIEIETTAVVPGSSAR